MAKWGTAPSARVRYWSHCSASNTQNSSQRFPKGEPHPAPIPRVYDAATVQYAITSAAHDFKGPIPEFALQYAPQLSLLVKFATQSYDGKVTVMSQLTPAESTNLLYIFRDLYRKGKVAGVAPGHIAEYDAMVEKYLDLLKTRKCGAVSVAAPFVDALYSPSYSRLCGSALGNFLPELAKMSSDRRFQALTTLAPVVKKMAKLVRKFSHYLRELEHSGCYNVDFYRAAISVGRYKALHAHLDVLCENGVTPAELLSFIENPLTPRVHEILHSELTGPLDNLVFQKYRNVLSMIFIHEGLGSFEEVFSFVRTQLDDDRYSAKEKALLSSFMETFLPLVYDGVISHDMLSQIKYNCLPVRYKGEEISAVKTEGNIFDNYELALLELFDVSPKLYLLGLVADTHSYEGVIDELSRLLPHTSELLQKEIIEFQELLQALSSFALTEPKFSNRPNLVLSPPATPRASNIVIDGRKVEDFAQQLHEFRELALGSLKYAFLGLETSARLIQRQANDFSDTQLAPLAELLWSTRDIADNDASFLDGIADKWEAPQTPATYPATTTEVATSPEAVYLEIPEHLKLHTLHDELHHLRYAVLAAPFSSFSASEIQTSLLRYLEDLDASSALGNEGDVSKGKLRKLFARLKDLFGHNGGNTEVLDAVLGSQSVFNKFEARKSTADHKKQTEPQPFSELNLYAPGEYTQIPENLGLYDYVNELEIFRNDELRSSFRNFSAERILGLLHKRIDEIYKGLPNSNLASRFTTENLVRFINLEGKLKKLLAWNGGATDILDTIIHSQNVFSHFEAKKEAGLPSSQTPKEYVQIPSNMVLEEYASEICHVRRDLGKLFADSSTEEVLSSTLKLANMAKSTDEAIILRKLHQNLKVLFKHNNEHAFVLDQVLQSSSVFASLEKKLADAGKKASLESLNITTEPVSDDVFGNKFNMTDFLKSDENAEFYSASKFDNNSAEETILRQDEAIIADAVELALSAEEKKVFDEDQTEFEAIRNLTAQKIRDKYKRSKAPKVPLEEGKENLLNFLKKSSDESKIVAEREWRQQKAYEWSKSMCNSQRSLDRKNFFDPSAGISASKHVPMFPSAVNRGEQFLVLTLTGQSFVSNENPLGNKHVPEDMFTVLQRFSDSDLKQLSKNIRDLQKRNWKLIGGGKGSNKMIVLSRPAGSRARNFAGKVKSLLAITGFAFVALVGVDSWFDDSKDVKAPLEESAVSAPVDQNVEEVSPGEIATPENLPLAPLWKRMLWK